MRSIRTSENNAVSEAASRLAISSNKPTAKGRIHILASVLPTVAGELIPSALVRGQDQTAAWFPQPQPPFAIDDTADTMNRDFQPVAEIGGRMARGKTKQQLVVLAPAQRQIKPVPRHRLVMPRAWNRIQVHLRANAGCAPEYGRGPAAGRR